MRVYCVAPIEDKKQARNLKDCIKILGGEPIEENGVIKTSYEGDQESCQRFIDLFKHFHNHGIYSESKN